MLTSKERALLRGKATSTETTLMVGKGGVTEQLAEEADRQLEARELVKGRVLDAALMSPQEALEAICAATGADPVGTIGTRFILYRKSQKLEAIRRAEGRAKSTVKTSATANPVRKGAQARRRAKKAEQERRNAYFKQSAIDNAIARSKAKKMREENSDN